MKMKPGSTFWALRVIAHAIQWRSADDATREINSLMRHKIAENRPAWVRELRKLRTIIQGGSALYSVFSIDGNSKLPFAAFSSLPGVTCPGAGECLSFCYSFKGWRYPAAFCRQAQNAWLMRHDRGAIVGAFNALPKDIKVRLYVDGDFASSSDVSFWFDLLNQRPDLQAYGYSKSFREILEHADNGAALPANYLLNISSGHAHDAHTVDRVASLSITRGTFSAVSIGRKVKSSEHGTVSVNRAITSVAGKVFPCPGQCGTCRNGDHACGSEKLRGIPIAIAVH